MADYVPWTTIEWQILKASEFVILPSLGPKLLRVFAPDVRLPLHQPYEVDGLCSLRYKYGRHAVLAAALGRLVSRVLRREFHGNGG